MKTLFPIKGSPQQELELIAGRVRIGVTGAVGAITGGLGVTSVTRDSAGVYIFLLEDEPATIYGAKGIVRSDAAVDLQVQLETISESTKTITLRCVAVAAETDPGDGDDLCFEFLVSRKQVGRAA